MREIRGSPASGSVAQANGVQFFQGGNAYITLALGQYAQRALYHEMYHVMETRLLTDSAAFDRWDALNPADFAYDYDYTANAARQADQYLQPETRSFIDRYSMSFPKEDRARDSGMRHDRRKRRALPIPGDAGKTGLRLPGPSGRPTV